MNGAPYSLQMMPHVQWVQMPNGTLTQVVFEQPQQLQAQPAPHPMMYMPTSCGAASAFGSDAFYQSVSMPPVYFPQRTPDHFLSSVCVQQQPAFQVAPHSSTPKVSPPPQQKFQIALASEDATPPCAHNNWDNLRAKHSIVTLCCRDCQKKWKQDFPIRNLCAEFHSKLQCAFDVNCPFLHVHRFKSQEKSPNPANHVVGAARDESYVKIAQEVLAEFPGKYPSDVVSMVNERYALARSTNNMSSLSSNAHDQTANASMATAPASLVLDTACDDEALFTTSINTPTRVKYSQANSVSSITQTLVPEPPVAHTQPALQTAAGTNVNMGHVHPIRIGRLPQPTQNPALWSPPVHSYAPLHCGATPSHQLPGSSTVVHGSMHMQQPIVLLAQPNQPMWVNSAPRVQTLQFS